LSFWIVMAALAALAAAWWIFARVVSPLSRLRASLKSIARGEHRSIPHLSRLKGIQEVAADLQVVADRLRELDEQMRVEQFNSRTILGSMIEGVLIVDRSQRIRLVNYSMHRMFHLQRALLGRSVIEVFRDRGLDRTVAEALAAGAPQSKELQLEVFDGARYTPKHFEVTAVSLRPNEAREPVGAVVVFHDITKIKALETMRQEFVANVSHELRTPLSIITGYIETLLDGAIDDREATRKFLTVMQRHGERLTLLIEDLLTISKLESGGGRLELEPIDLRDCVERVAARLESRIAQQEATLAIDIPPDFPQIDADWNRMDQVFFNLLDNALKYANKPSVAVRISAQADGSEAKIAVADNGTGIPVEDQPHIFERFYRVHKDRSRAAGGTGLGLSIVKHVVQAHGGRVTVGGAPGQGTTFEIVLPIRQAKGDAE
jgi:two-component system, OmpR family, phosphate regulon sensor histidine kinase PhoR